MRTECYRTEGGELPVDVFDPDPAATDGGPVSAVVFLHGGAWRMGDRSQFHPQCERLAAAGHLAATAAYTLDGTILRCALDARAAMDHVLDRADEWGVDTARVAVGGGSAGGHLAACLATCPDLMPAVRPAAAVLFNPVLDLVATMRVLGDLAPEVGCAVEQLSPVHQDLGACPPTVVFHGTDDSLVPIGQSRAFRDAALAVGSRCELVEFEGREHAFFNPVPSGLEDAINAGDFDTTTAATATFLADVLGSGVDGSDLLAGRVPDPD